VEGADPEIRGPATKYPPVLLKHVLEQGSETLDHFRKRAATRPGSRSTSQRNPDEIVEEVFGQACAAEAPGFRRAEVEVPGEERQAPLPRVNADESEPGTFKDKMLIDRGPPRAARGS
jgi:NADH:ubiquinone oxidoreductase subunit F (NADH-binding)